jgi:hypothetical protein
MPPSQAKSSGSPSHSRRRPRRSTSAQSTCCVIASPGRLSRACRGRAARRGRRARGRRPRARTATWRPVYRRGARPGACAAGDRSGPGGSSRHRSAARPRRRSRTAATPKPASTATRLGTVTAGWSQSASLTAPGRASTTTHHSSALPDMRSAYRSAFSRRPGPGSRCCRTAKTTRWCTASRARRRGCTCTSSRPTSATTAVTATSHQVTARCQVSSPWCSRAQATCHAAIAGAAAR